MASLWQSLSVESLDYYEESPWFPNPLICARNIAITGTREVYQRLPWNGVGQWVNGTMGWLSQSDWNDPSAIYVPLLVALGLTLLRFVLNWLVFKPISEWCELTKEASDKFPESIWKVGVYSVTWLWCIYLLTSGPVNHFFNLRSHFDVWKPSGPIEPGIYWLYMVEMGFYMHCCYATIYLETIRKDFMLMMTHHTITLALLLFSHMTRFHIMGLILLSLLDIGDVLLETSKCFNYFKDRGHKKHVLPEIMANVCFGIFTLLHMMSRLYWFFTKVLYSGMHLSSTVFPGGPYYLFLNPLMMGIFIMQLYWFKFILQLLWKIVVLREALEDNRDFKEESEDVHEDTRNGTKKQN